jgi:hypothetical protein
MRITLIVGLPGSGKSMLAQEIASRTPGTVVVDDPQAINCLDSIPRDAPGAVVTHPAFCRAKARDLVKQEILRRFPDADLEWVFFANDGDQCRVNAGGRDCGRIVAGYIDLLSRHYEIPSETAVRPVYRPDCAEDVPTSRGP